MTQTAKIFSNGRSQAVRLPAAFRFAGDEVFIRRDEATGDVILSGKPAGWEGFLRLLTKADVPDDFLSAAERGVAEDERDPFAGWVE